MSTDTASAVPSVPAEVDAQAGAAVGAGPGVEVAVQGSAAPLGLAERDRAVLAFERQWWRFAGAKEAAIRERFGLSATRYYQLLNALVDRPEALAADPLLVRRLRRMRAVRQRARHGDVLGTDG